MDKSYTQWLAASVPTVNPIRFGLRPAQNASNPDVRSPFRREHWRSSRNPGCDGLPKALTGSPKLAQLSQRGNSDETYAFRLRAARTGGEDRQLARMVKESDLYEI